MYAAADFIEDMFFQRLKHDGATLVMLPSDAAVLKQVQLERSIGLTGISHTTMDTCFISVTHAWVEPLMDSEPTSR